MNRRLVATVLTAVLSGTALVGTATSASADTELEPDCREVKCVALSFDDGPVADTERLLRILNSRNAKATFYPVGENVQRYPEITRAAALTGHQIGNHTWDHPNLTTLSEAEIKSQLSRADEVIEEVTGEKPSTLRAPYGAHNATVREAAQRPLVHWSVDPRDWDHRDSEQTIEHITEETRPGDVVLMHDIHTTTVDAVPGVLDGLEERGFHFVTVDQLFEHSELPAGEVTRHNRDAYRP